MGSALRAMLVVCGIVLGLAVLLGVGAFTMRDELFPIVVGSEAPEFAARTVEGPATVRTLADYRGKVVVLNVWGSWCAPCRAEAPNLAAVAEDLADEGVQRAIDGAPVRKVVVRAPKLVNIVV